MNISTTSLLTALLVSFIIAVGLAVLIELYRKNRIVSAKVLLAISFVFMARLMLPMEFFFTITIPSREILPVITEFLRLDLFRLLGVPMSVGNVLVGIWIVGILIATTVFIRKLREIGRLKKILGLSKAKAGQLVFTDQKVAPMVIGLRDPIIIMPKLDLTERQRELICRHELFHIASWDILVKYSYGVLAIFYWWNPVIHMFKKRLDLIIELKTDDQVIQQFSSAEKIEYVETLLKITQIIEETQVHKVSAETGFFAAFSSSVDEALLFRAKNILASEKKKVSHLQIILLCCSCFLLSTSFIFEPYKIPEEVENSTFTITPENAHLVEIEGDKYELYHEGVFEVVITERQRKERFSELRVIE